MSFPTSQCPHSVTFRRIDRRSRHWESGGIDKNLQDDLHAYLVALGDDAALVIPSAAEHRRLSRLTEKPMPDVGASIAIWLNHFVSELCCFLLVALCGSALAQIDRITGEAICHTLGSLGAAWNGLHERASSNAGRTRYLESAAVVRSTRRSPQTPRSD